MAGAYARWGAGEQTCGARRSAGRPALEAWAGQSSQASTGLTGLDQQTDPGPLLTVDGDVDERWNTDEVEAAGRHVTAGDGDRLDGLIDGAGADRLDFHPALTAYHAGDRARDRDRLGGGRHLQDLDGRARCPGYASSRAGR